MLKLKFSLSDFYYLYIYTAIILAIFFCLLFFLQKHSKLEKKKRIQILIYFYGLSLGFSFLGLTTGLLIGLSKSPVVGVVIPALLTFFGGFVTYSFIFAQKKYEDGYVMIVILLCVSFSLILGVDYGTSIRLNHIKGMIEHPLNGTFKSGDTTSLQTDIKFNPN